MSPPPALATSEPRVEHISAVSETDLTTRTQQMRYLVAELGITRQQAHRLIKAYEADLADEARKVADEARKVADAARIGNDTGRSDLDFLDWLLRQAPGGRVRSVKKREWRTS